MNRPTTHALRALRLIAIFTTSFLVSVIAHEETHNVQFAQAGGAMQLGFRWNLNLDPTVCPQAGQNMDIEHFQDGLACTYPTPGTDAKRMPTDAEKPAMTAAMLSTIVAGFSLMLLVPEVPMPQASRRSQQS